MGIITWPLYRFLQAKPKAAAAVPTRSTDSSGDLFAFSKSARIPHKPLVPPAMCGTTRKQLLAPSQRDEPRLGHKRDRDPRVEEIHCTYVVVSCTAFRRVPHIKSSAKQATHHRPSTTAGFPWSPPSTSSSSSNNSRRRRRRHRSPPSRHFPCHQERQVQMRQPHTKSFP